MENLAPFIANVAYQQCAVYSHPNYGPTFGGGHDLFIGDNANRSQQSYSNFGHSYNSPPVTVQRSSLLAGSYNFTPTEVEVFI